MSGTDSGSRDALRLLEPFAGEEARLLACVHCGFCLDACPTYTRLGLESDSPRGRLYLMRAVAEGRVAPDAPAFQKHLDQCLGCRACEPVCPSGVQYGYLLERGREVIARSRPTSRLDRLLLATFGSRAATRLAMLFGRMLRASGLASGLLTRISPKRARIRFALAMLASSRRWSGLHAAGRAVPAHTDRSSGNVAAGESIGLPSSRPAVSTVDPAAVTSSVLPAGAPGRSDTSEPGLRVTTLRGCVQEGLFDRVNRATDEALKANGCTIVDAPGQGCCGALHAHGGQLDAARRLAKANMEAFADSGIDFIVVNAAGCGAAMKEYGELFENRPESERAHAFARRVVDATELLARLGPREGAPIHLRAACDLPCHLLHAQRIERAPLDVLRAVPGLEVELVARADECCGGAGTYGLTHPDLGGRILSDKISAVRDVEADVVVTGNPGCMMQIGAGLQLCGDATPVLHPIELLAESYRRMAASAP
jgi:glycolate dehydrogenase iron-sulfur subunit